MENEFLILLQAKLEEAKSKGNINSDIEKIQGQIEKLKLKAEIDPKVLTDLVKQVEEVLNQKIEISNISINQGRTVKSAEQAGQKIGNAINQGVSQRLGNVEKLESFQKSLLNAGMDSTLVSSVADEISKLNVQIDSLNQSVSNIAGGKNILSVNIEGVDELGQSVKLVRQFDVETGKLVKTIESVSSAQQKTTSTIEKEITTYTNKLKDFQAQYSNANIDYSEFNKVFDSFKNGEATVNQLSVAFNELKNSAKASVQNLKSQDSSLNEIQQTINNMRDFPAMIDSLKTGMSELKDQTKVADISIDDLSESYNELKSVMDSVGGKVPLTDEWTKKYRELMSTVVSLTKQVETLKRVESSDNSLVKAKDISDKVDLGNYDKDFKVLTESFKRLGLSAEEIEVRVKDVSVALDKLKEKNLETLVQDEKDFVTVLKKSQNEARILRTDLENIYNPKRQMNLSTNIQNWLSKNTRAAHDAKQSLQEYYRELTGGRVSVDRLEFIERELKKIDTEQRGLGKLGKNLKDQFAEAGKSFSQWLSISSGIMALVYQLQKIPKEVITVNKAMVELRKVSDASSSDITKYFDEAANSAKRYGSAVSDMINATADWSRLGYSLPDAKKLAEVATLYTNVGDGIDMNTANEHLISTLQGFQLEAEDALGIIDRFNEVNLIAS